MTELRGEEIDPHDIAIGDEFDAIYKGTTVFQSAVAEENRPGTNYVVYGKSLDGSSVAWTEEMLENYTFRLVTPSAQSTPDNPFGADEKAEWEMPKPSVDEGGNVYEDQQRDFWEWDGQRLQAHRKGYHEQSGLPTSAHPFAQELTWESAVRRYGPLRLTDQKSRGRYLNQDTNPRIELEDIRRGDTIDQYNELGQYDGCSNVANVNGFRHIQEFSPKFTFCLVKRTEFSHKEARIHENGTVFEDHEGDLWESIGGKLLLRLDHGGDFWTTALPELSQPFTYSNAESIADYDEDGVCIGYTTWFGEELGLDHEPRMQDIDEAFEEWTDEDEELVVHGEGDIFSKARAMIDGDRQVDYGSAQQSFERIAGLWSAYKGVEFTAQEAAMMMTLLKISRSRTSSKEDTFVDMAAYIKLAWDMREDTP